MRTLVLSLGVSVVASACIAQDEGAPKNIDVRVFFPKKLALKKDPVAGGETASFTVRMDVKNKGREAVVFSSAVLDARIRELLPTQVAVEKSIDALLIAGGRNYSTERKVVINTAVPEAGAKYSVEFFVYGKKYTGVVAVPK